MEGARQKTIARAATVQPAAVPKVSEIRATASRANAVLQTSSLKVSSPTDAAEKEADSTAKKVMRMALPANDAVSPSMARFTAARALIHRTQERDTIARRGEGPTEAPASVRAEIQGSVGGGAPLPVATRRFMEPRFRADFRNVRIHTGDRAAALSLQLGARAFTVGNQIFFGRNQFQPDTPEGRELLAHELTHTVQQGSVVQRSEDVTVTQRTAPHVQRGVFDRVLGFFADAANAIPGYRLFTLVLGVNPINMSRVERSAANILRAVVEFLPGGGLITRALDAYGVFDRVGRWIEQQIDALGITSDSIRRAFDQFLNRRNALDVLHPDAVWNDARRIFADPADRIVRLVRSLGAEVLRIIKEAILRPLANLASRIRGWDLLCAVLERNPITGEAVPRNAETLIGGFMRMINQEELWQNLQRARALPRAWAWFQTALGGALGLVREVPQLFLRAVQALSIDDLAELPTAFGRAASVFGDFYLRFFTWAGTTVWNLLEIIFDVVAPDVMVYLRRAAGAFRTILRDPIGFVRNLVNAGILGLRQFARNFLTHLRASLIGWLTGAMSGANIYIPQALNLREILKFVLSVLGLTWQNVRQKIVRVIGEPATRALEVGFELVTLMVTQGPAAAWEKIREHLSNLREMVMEQIMTFVRERIVNAAITRLVTMLVPGSAFIQAIVATYDTVMFFVERLRQIGRVAAAFIDSIAAIASGNLTNAANRVEQTMAGMLTLVISFLARVVRLGDVSTAVTNVVDRVRRPVDQALDRVVDWIVAQARRLGRAITGSATQPSTATANQRRNSDIDEPVSVGSEGHTLRAHFDGTRYRFLMASRVFSDVSDTLTQLKQHYLAQGSGIFRGKPIETDFENRIKSVVDRRDRAVREAEPHQQIVNRTMNSAAAAEVDRILHAALADMKQMIRQIGIDFVFGPGASVAPGMIIRLIPQNVGASVKAVGLIDRGHIALKVEYPTSGNPDRGYETYLKYVDYSVAWDMPTIPPFSPFHAIANGGWVQIDKANLVKHETNASHTPPGWSSAGPWNERGHLVANVFGGPGGANNIVAQTHATNVAMRLGPEKTVLDDIKKRMAVYHYHVTVTYDSTQIPPKSIHVVANLLFPPPSSKKTFSLGNP